MNKIQIVSKIMRYIFSILFLLIPISLIIFWINAPDGVLLGNNLNHIHLSFIPAGTPILSPLTTQTKILGFIISLIPSSIEMLLLYFLIRLFSLYQQSQIFVLQSAAYIRKIGYMILLAQIVQPAFQMLMSLAMTYNNPPHYRLLTFSFDQTNIGILIIGIIIVLVSWIMSEGCKLQQEQDFTI